MNKLKLKKNLSNSQILRGKENDRKIKKNDQTKFADLAPTHMYWLCCNKPLSLFIWGFLASSSSSSFSFIFQVFLFNSILQYEIFLILFFSIVLIVNYFLYFFLLNKKIKKLMQPSGVHNQGCSFCGLTRDNLAYSFFFSLIFSDISSQ